MHVQVCKEKSKCYRQWLWVRQTGSHCQSWLIVLLLRTEGLLLLLHDDHQVEEEGAEAPSDPLVVFSIFPSVLFSPYHHYCCRCLAVTAAVTCTGITFTVAHCQHTHTGTDTQAQTYSQLWWMNTVLTVVCSFNLYPLCAYCRKMSVWVSPGEQWKRAMKKKRERGGTHLSENLLQSTSQSVNVQLCSDQLTLTLQPLSTTAHIAHLDSSCGRAVFSAFLSFYCASTHLTIANNSSTDNSTTILQPFSGGAFFATICRIFFHFFLRAHCFHFVFTFFYYFDAHSLDFFCCNFAAFSTLVLSTLFLSVSLIQLFLFICFVLCFVFHLAMIMCATCFSMSLDDRRLFFSLSVLTTALKVKFLKKIV